MYCTEEKVKKDVKLSEGPEWVCTECGAVIHGHKRYLQRHIAAQHNFQPVRCDVEGCTNTTLFQTKSKLNSHRESSHNLHYPRRCSYEEECTSIFRYPSNYREHLAYTHHLTPTALVPYLPSRPKFDGATCPECGKQERRKCQFIKHMVKVHSRSMEDAEALCMKHDPWIVRSEEAAKNA